MSLLYVAVGDFDETNVRQLRDVYDELANAGQNVTIDMGEVTTIDGSGLGAIVYLMKRLQAAGCRLNLIKVQSGPYSLMKSLGVADILVDDGAFSVSSHTVFDPKGVLALLSSAQENFKRGLVSGTQSPEEGVSSGSAIPKNSVSASDLGGARASG